MNDNFDYNAALLCSTAFQAILETTKRPAIVEIMVYRLNAVAATSYTLDGSEPFLQFVGLDKSDTYVTRHKVEDILTVVHIADAGHLAERESAYATPNFYHPPLPPRKWTWYDSPHLCTGELLANPTQQYTANNQNRFGIVPVSPSIPGDDNT